MKSNTHDLYQMVYIMTDNDIRIKIATLCGFTNIHEASREEALEMSAFMGEDSHIGMIIGVPSPEQSHYYNRTMEIPDYPNDLNAVYQAEKHLVNDSNEISWIDNLALSCPSKDYHNTRGMLQTTARQRSEALILTFSELCDN